MNMYAGKNRLQTVRNRRKTAVLGRGSKTLLLKTDPGGEYADLGIYLLRNHSAIAYCFAEVKECLGRLLAQSSLVIQAQRPNVPGATLFDAGISLFGILYFLLINHHS